MLFVMTIYHKFAGFGLSEVADKAVLITPARFLLMQDNPKCGIRNKKKISIFQVIYFAQNWKVFPKYRYYMGGGTS